MAISEPRPQLGEDATVLNPELYDAPSDDGPSSSGTRYTPDSDSDDSDFGFQDEHEGQSIQLKRAKTNSGVNVYVDEEDEGLGRSQRRASISTVQSYQLYTPDEERAVVKKFDRRLVLFVALLYMLSFLDRSNIGNARIAGMDRDLKLDSDQYEWVLTSFYIAYICFEWMSLLWKIVPAHIYVSIIVLSWGVIASLQSIATSFASLLALRILLGIGEAGFTGIPFYLSFFFKREELALRTGFFISAAPLATSFASSLAWVIVKLGTYGPIASWRLLFLIEGFPSVLVAIVAWYQIPDGPAAAYYLTKREKKVARLRLRKNNAASKVSGRGLKGRDMLKTMMDPKSYMTAFMFFFTNMAFSSMPAFLPTIIKSMGHSTLGSQALSAPPYLVSFIAVIITAYLSDRTQNRSFFICFHALLSAFGYAMIALGGKLAWTNWVRYSMIYPAAVGFFSVITIVITWTINNQESESGQGMGFAMLQIIGQCGPLVGTRLYPDEDAPFYVKGMTVCSIAMVFVAILSLSLRFYLQRENSKTQESEYAHVGDEDTEGLVSKELILPATGFRYML